METKFLIDIRGATLPQRKQLFRVLKNKGHKFYNEQSCYFTQERTSWPCLTNHTDNHWQGTGIGSANENSKIVPYRSLLGLRNTRRKSTGRSSPTYYVKMKTEKTS